jgi:hypothetical protein
MPFKLVSSRRGTGFPLRKELIFLWDKYDLSIDPDTWIIHVGKELVNTCDEYNIYHQRKMNGKVITLLKENAEIELLKMHHDKFLQMEKIRASK